MGEETITIVTISGSGITVLTNDPMVKAEFDNYNESVSDEGGGDFHYTLTPRQLRRFDRVVRQLERSGGV